MNVSAARMILNNCGEKCLRKGEKLTAMTTITVKLRQSYDVLIAPGILDLLGENVRKTLPRAKTAAVITDSNTGELYLARCINSLREAGLDICSFSVPAGEASKSGAQYISLLNLLAEKRITRSDVIIALGGGVVGDLAGFVAATYLRGTPFVQVPTTLLAMVDSSVGGKTAIDLPAGKNLAGAFYQPSLVLCDTDALNTLPDMVFRDGSAEVIKYGMLGSAELLDIIPKYREPGCLDAIIAKCIAMKRDIVQKDEFDTGERMLLNFGHTIGHAIEKLSGYEISHGFAVAVGMAVDTRAAVRKNLCPPECLEILKQLLAQFDLPDSTGFSPEELYRAALHDKKRAGDEITIIVPRTLGLSELRKIPAASLLDWIETGLRP